MLLTAWTHLETAVELVKAGAADYLAKPWDDHKLLATVENLLELSEATREVARVREERRKRRKALDAKYDLRGLMFASTATERVVELACQVARADIPVLITGANGAGKERIAEIIQANSAVKNGPFITVNCGALPSELIEAELFGADPGAYTGAPNRAREGRFEIADGGTLFLDEIGNLPLAGQAKLLRVLESGQFERLGSSEDAHDESARDQRDQCRHRRDDPRRQVSARISITGSTSSSFALPPLAERRDDIVPLAEHFLDGKARRSTKARAPRSSRTPGPATCASSRTRSSARRCLCKDGLITADDLGLAAVRNGNGRPAPAPEPDREMIEAALSNARGVISQAAAELGLSRQALYRRMDKLGISAG